MICVVQSTKIKMLKGKSFLITKSLTATSVGLLKKAQGTSQPAFTCSKLTIETLEQGVKYVQS